MAGSLTRVAVHWHGHPHYTRSLAFHSLTHITLTHILTHSSTCTHSCVLHSHSNSFIGSHSLVSRIALTHSYSHSLTHWLAFLLTHSLARTHSHHMHSLMCMYILCRYIRMLTVINTFLMSILFIIFDEFFFTKDIYQFLQTIIKLLNVARSDIYFSEYNDSRKQDNWK